VKNGSILPEGFQLAGDGTFSGTAPLLPSGTTRRITPPFTVVATDADGKMLDIQLSVTILQATPTATPVPLTTAPATTTSSATTRPKTIVSTPVATIDTVQCEYIDIDWSNTEGDAAYRYRITAFGTASGPAGTAIKVYVGIKAMNAGWYDDRQEIVNAPDWTYVDTAYSCARRTAADPDNISWTLTQEIIVNYGPNAGTAWPADGNITIEARVLTANEGGGYGSVNHYSQPVPIPAPP
jgi:hypothetical protein